LEETSKGVSFYVEATSETRNNHDPNNEMAIKYYQMRHQKYRFYTCQIALIANQSKSKRTD
jgi:hypothetical protein